MDREIHNFFQYGTQYYLVGRFAAFAGQTPIVGNVMHHAIEFFLKGALSKSMTLAEMKVQLGHSLLRSWNAFKAIAPTAELSRFDPTVSALDAFEDIRYPDDVIAKGVYLQIDIVKQSELIPEFQEGYSPPRYKLSLEEIDELVAAICKSASRNPQAYFQFMQANAREYIARENKYYPT